MAKKGQKFINYTDDMIKTVLLEIKTGKSLRQIAREQGIPTGTIMTWSYKANHPEKNTGNKRGRQKEKDLTKEDYKERYEILKKYRAFLREQREKR